MRSFGRVVGEPVVERRWGLSTFENVTDLVKCEDLVAAWERPLAPLLYQALQDPDDPNSVIVAGPQLESRDAFEGDYWWCPDSRPRELAQYSVGSSSRDGRFQLSAVTVALFRGTQYWSCCPEWWAWRLRSALPGELRQYSRNAWNCSSRHSVLMT